MTYTEKGETNEKYAVWNRAVILPIAGKIVTRIEHAKDNSPNLIAAIDLDDHSDGKDVILEEKPQNLIEVKPIDGQNSPFLLRMIHLRQDSIPASIEVNFTNLKLRIWDFMLANFILSGFDKSFHVFYFRGKRYMTQEL